jgi:FkbM family methyltransferase
MSIVSPRFAQNVGWASELAYSAIRACYILGLPAPAATRLKPKQVPHPLSVRLGSASDLIVFGQIFRLEEYASLREIPARFVLDLGANAGYSSAYFLSCFPQATVLAVEPDPSNFAMCRQNLAPYGKRARLVQGAAWSRRGMLALSRGTFRDGRQWATAVRESSDPAEAVVEAWDVPSLLELAGFSHIDLLKVDIEGSEVTLFSENAGSWIPAVRNLCIELHGQACREALDGALAVIALIDRAKANSRSSGTSVRKPSSTHPHLDANRTRHPIARQHHPMGPRD